MIIDELIEELRGKGYSIGEYTSDVVESNFIGSITKSRNYQRRKKREKKRELMASLGMNNLKDDSEVIIFHNYPAYYRFVMDNKKIIIDHRYKKNEYIVKVRREH